MQVDVYSHPTDRTYGVLVPSGAGISHLPPEIQQQGGGLVYWKSYDLNADDSRVGLDSRAAVADLEGQGYHVARVQITTTITDVPGKPA